MPLSTLRPLALGLALAFAPAAGAATITVTSGTDDGAGGCTLREAVEAATANAAVGACPAGDDDGDAVVIGVAEVILTEGEIVISDDLRIAGGAVVGAFDQRLFRVTGDAVVSFENVDLTGGGHTDGAADGAGIRVEDTATVTVTAGTLRRHVAPARGGALWVAAGATLSVDGVAFVDNAARGAGAADGGGAIYTDGGPVTVANSTFTNSRAIGAAGSGGAILNPNGAALTVTASTFVGSRSQRAGGAIETVGGTTTVTDCTFEDNQAGVNPGNGGAIHGGGDVALTVSGGAARENRAQEGGAFWISSAGTLAVVGVAVEANFAFGNDADQGGGGVYVDGGAATISGGAFTDNSAPGTAGSGGAVLVNGGTAAVFGGAVFSGNSAVRAGGAVEVVGPAEVTVRDGVRFEANLTGPNPGNGAGLHVTGDGRVTVENVALVDNRATAEGGGLWNSGAGTLTVRRATFSDNRAERGGGLYQQAGDAGASDVRESLFEGNDASNGGGLFAGGALAVANSTLYANTARFGAGAWTDGASVRFESVTAAQNEARTAGGGIANADPNVAGPRLVILRNTIVAGNTAPSGPDLAGRLASDGYNLLGSGPTAATFPALDTDRASTDPLLGPLADNGGPTLTAALLEGSPAIDTGNTRLDVDQRGAPRAGADDVGAFEFGAPIETDAEEGLEASALGLDVAPSPVASRATATVRVEAPQTVRVELYDAVGRRVAVVFEGAVAPAAPRAVALEARGLADGVYVLVVTGETGRASRLVTVAR